MALRTDTRLCRHPHPPALELSASPTWDSPRPSPGNPALPLETLLSLWESDCSRDLMSVGSHSTCPFVSGLFHSTCAFKEEDLTFKCPSFCESVTSPCCACDLRGAPRSTELFRKITWQGLGLADLWRFTSSSLDLNQTQTGFSLLRAKLF